MSYEDMDFSEMEVIRAEKKAMEEDQALKPKIPWWRRLLEISLDQ